MWRSALFILLLSFVVFLVQSCTEPSTENALRFDCTESTCTHSIFWSNVLGTATRAIADFNVTHELAFVCLSDKFEPIWLLSSEEEFNECRVTSSQSRIVANCTACSQPVTSKFLYFRTTDFEIDRIQVSPGQTLYFAALAVDGSGSSCTNGVKLRVSVEGQATIEPPSPDTKPTSAPGTNPSIEGVQSTSSAQTLTVSAITLLLIFVASFVVYSV